MNRCTMALDRVWVMDDHPDDLFLSIARGDFW